MAEAAHLFVKIGAYVLFLLSYGLWVALNGFVLQRRARSRPTAATEWLSVATSIAVGMALIVFVFLLSGFFSPALLALLLGTTVVCILLGFIVQAVLGSPEATAELTWEGFFVGAHHPWVYRTVTGIYGLAFIAYPILAGVLMFSHTASPQLALLVLRASLVVLIFAGYPGMVLLYGNFLLSESLDEASRTLVMASLTVGMLQTTVYLSLTFWAFGIGRHGATFSISSVFASLTGVLIAGLIVYLALVVLLPYLIGSERGKKWRIRFTSRRRELLSAAIRGLDVPKASVKLEELKEVGSEVAQEIQGLREDKAIATGTELESEPDLLGTPGGKDDLRYLRESYVTFRRRDPRFQQLDWLGELRDRLQNAQDDLGDKKSSAAVHRVSDEWATTFRNWDRDLEKELEEARRTKSKIGVAAGFLISSGIVSQALALVTKIISSNISHSLPK